MNERISPAVAGAGPWTVTTAGTGSKVRGTWPSGGGRKPASGGSSRIFALCSASPSRRQMSGGSPRGARAARGHRSRATNGQVRRGGCGLPASFPVLQGGLRHSGLELAALAAARKERDEDGHARDCGEGQEHPHAGEKCQADADQERQHRGQRHGGPVAWGGGAADNQRRGNAGACQRRHGVRGSTGHTRMARAGARWWSRRSGSRTPWSPGPFARSGHRRWCRSHCRGP